MSNVFDWGINANATPPLAFRFSVTAFLAGLVPSPLDFRFQRVSGISSTVTTHMLNEGGQNLYAHRLPERVEYENLVLERGMSLVSPWTFTQFNAAMSLFQFQPCNVLVLLHDRNGLPLGAWLFRNAYPVKWELSDFDADANAVVIESMELAYQNILTVRT